MLKKLMPFNGSPNSNSIGPITLTKEEKMCRSELLMPLSGILINILVMDPGWWSPHSPTESMWLLPKPSILRWDAPLLDLLEQEKQKQPKIYPLHWLKPSMCLTAQEKWTMNQWEISTKDSPHLDAGDVSFSSTVLYQKCYPSAPYSSRVSLMSSNNKRRDSFFKVIKLVWIQLVVSSLLWIQVILEEPNFLKVSKPCSDPSL